MQPFENLTTERLILRKISQEIFDFLYANYTDEQLLSFLGIADMKTLAIEKEKYRKGLSTFNKTFLYFKVLDKTNEKVIGWCGYHTWYLDHNRAEIGYGLYDDAYKQKGLMSEALKTILDYGFNQIKLHRVEALIGSENEASQNLVKKFGFTYEGKLREHYFVNNRMEDSLVFRLLKNEYQHLK